MDDIDSQNFHKAEDENHGQLEDIERSYIPEYIQPGIHSSVYPPLPSSVVTDQPLNAILTRTSAPSGSTSGVTSSPPGGSREEVQGNMIPAILTTIEGAHGEPHVGIIISGETSDVTTPNPNIIPPHSSSYNPGVTLWMAPPAGLTPLAAINKIIIDRKDDKCKAKGFSLHKYTILNESGHRMYSALEEHFAWKKFGSGCQEKLVARFLDESGTEVIKATKELTFSDCEILVEASAGEIFGYVRKAGRGSVVLNSSKETVFSIRDALTPFCLCGSFDAKVIGMDGSTIGHLEMENLSSQSYISFPKDLDCRMKAVLLSFTILGLNR